MPPAPEHDHYVPKHRLPPARRASKTAVRTMFLLSSVAVVGTGVAVAGGTVTLSPETARADAAASTTSIGNLSPSATPPAEPSSPATTSPSAGPSAAADDEATREQLVERAEVGRRVAPVSRSDRRGTADPLKAAVLSTEADGNAMTRSEDMSGEDPRTIAQTLLGDDTQFGCLDSLWTKESGWRVDADNPSSSAYGIPQALPGSKMSSFGADWATNPVTQIRWGLDYIEDRYGSPCGAWSHSQSNGWY